ncbi:MAG TPA: thiamine pyrophosphate-binding protein [Rhodocyclaceae bacterium]|nr:thiamine pyrophosphate-binding protein [Rhodocyclaceae bacterium]
MSALRLAGHLLVEELIAQGTDTVFGVPGESFLAVLDGLHEHRARIGFVTCRHEGGASVMAEAHGKLTGDPGVCLVTRGPGAANAAIGLHTAFQDSTPMILLIGQVAREHQEREAFQEVDYRRMFGQSAKWVAQVDDAGRIAEFVARAYQEAVNGRPGPVVLALPEDMLMETTAAGGAARHRRIPLHAGVAEMAELGRRLAAARRPLALIGGPGWTRRAGDDFRAFAEAWQLPVAAAFRYQDLFDNRHPLYAGDAGLGINPALASRIREADLLLAVGPRLGDATTSGYTLLDAPVPRQALIHVHAGIGELGRVYQPALPICATMPEACAALAALPPPDACAWTDWRRATGADYAEWIDRPTAGALDLAAVIRHASEALPDAAIVCNGAGNATVWLHRFFRYRPGPEDCRRTQLGPTSGAMGYGVPAAVAAAIRFPDRPVVTVCGDGDFLMTAQELATAVAHGARFVVLLVNNGIYGTIRMHQERRFPGRAIGSDLANPDFVAFARSFGAWAARVERTPQFAPAFAEALAVPGPAVIELVLDARVITPGSTPGGP